MIVSINHSFAVNILVVVLETWYDSSHIEGMIYQVQVKHEITGFYNCFKKTLTTTFACHWLLS